MKNKAILSIDLKSFFASCECINRGLDPFKTPLVVSDTSRGNGAITLAVTPYLKSLGVPSRGRLFELPKNIKIIYAKPRMRLYEMYSNKVYEIYKEFIAEEDIHIYSIDEVFIDATGYLKLYKMTDIELATTIMNRIKEVTGITSTAGIGPNIFLAKVAMDVEAKHNKNCIAKWTYDDIETKLCKIEPLTEIWGFGRRITKKLNNLKVYNLGDIKKYSKEFYIKRFGNVCGNDIWNKSNGIDYSTVYDYNNKSHDKSMSMSQVLYRDYSCEEALLIVKEMNDILNRSLRSKHMVTKRVYLFIDYSRIFCKSFHDAITLNIEDDNKDNLFKVLEYIYNKNIEDLPIRKIGIGYTNLSKKIFEQISLFDNESNTNEYYNLIDTINDKLGRTAVLRASSLLENSTIKNRERFKNII